jgi:hypothetical protein
MNSVEEILEILSQSKNTKSQLKIFYKKQPNITKKTKNNKIYPMEMARL